MSDPKKDLINFLVGIAMLGSGLFFFSQKVVVHSSFWGSFGLGGIRVTSGLLVVPLIAGIIWMFASDNKIGPGILIAVGVLLIIAGVIASTTISLTTITLYEWVLMLVLIFGGIGLLVKVMLLGGSKK